ncbi:hypothetical protein [Actinoplanes sp. NPDC023714]|uniref:hypothetical protein n=1 Tax=Actinoplanes sp. NPDC023714 TaxID=3154322 RepID=UPI003406276F
MSALHRRLLTLYPSDFRREYEEEMLAVLAADGRPGPAQVFDLVRAALLVRLARLPAAPPGLRRAARVAQFFGTLLLLAAALRRVVPFVPAGIEALDPLDVLRAAVWAVVLAAAWRGLRLLGFAGATAGLALEVAAPWRFYSDTPAMVLNAYWLIMAAAVVLVAGLAAARGGDRFRGVLPVLSAAGLLVALSEVYWLASSQLSPWLMLGNGSLSPYYMERAPEFAAGVLVLVAAAGLVLLAVFRQEPAVRRWLLAWAAPVLVTVPLIRSGFDAFIRHNAGHPEATRLLDGFQWAALVLVPLAAFLTVAHLTSRYERGRGPARTGGVA